MHPEYYNINVIVNKAAHATADRIDAEAMIVNEAADASADPGGGNATIVKNEADTVAG
jgi:hypothetical protein